MTTYDIAHNKRLYHLTLDTQGDIYELTVDHPDGGPSTNCDLNTLPQWLVARVQQWWTDTQEPI